MVSPALFHRWPGRTRKRKHADASSATKALPLRERRVALMKYLIKTRSQR